MVAGFVVMVITGALLFYAIPVRSYQSLWFRIKVIALILAGLNAFVFHAGIDRRVGRVGSRARRRRGRRAAPAPTSLCSGRSSSSPGG